MRGLARGLAQAQSKIACTVALLSLHRWWRRTTLSRRVIGQVSDIEQAPGFGGANGLTVASLRAEGQ